MILFFDTETTGKADFKSDHTKAHQPHVVQLAALLAEVDGTERATLSVIIKPDGWTIPTETAAIHGITTEIAERCGIPLFSAMSAFSNLTLRASKVVAHNIDFDMLICRAAFHRLGKSDAFKSAEGFCTMHATTEICQLPGPYGFKWPKLTEAHKHFFGTEVEGAHDAMADVRACARIYFELIKQN